MTALAVTNEHSENRRIFRIEEHREFLWKHEFYTAHSDPELIVLMSQEI